MKHLFVSYEAARALKELGFGEPCFGWFLDYYAALNAAIDEAIKLITK